MGGDENSDDKKDGPSSEEQAEIEEMRREIEEKRKEKHRKMEEERETMRQSIRDKVRTPLSIIPLKHDATIFQDSITSITVCRNPC